MTCLEIIAIIVVSSIALMMNVCVIGGVVERICAKHISTKTELATKVWDKELEYVDRIFDKYMTRIEGLFEKPKKSADD